MKRLLLILLLLPVFASGQDEVFTTVKADTFYLLTGPTSGYALITDGNGKGTWQAISSSGAVAAGWTLFTPEIGTTTPGNTVHIRRAAGDTTRTALFNVYGLADIDSLRSSLNWVVVNDSLSVVGLTTLNGDAAISGRGYVDTLSNPLTALVIADSATVVNLLTVGGQAVITDSLIVGTTSSEHPGPPFRFWTEGTGGAEDSWYVGVPGVDIGSYRIYSSTDAFAGILMRTTLTGNRIYTFPDLAGTVAVSGASQNVSFGTVDAGSNVNVTGYVNVDTVQNLIGPIVLKDTVNVDHILQTQQIKVTSGATLGYVLTSDGSGFGTWQSVAGPGASAVGWTLFTPEIGTTTPGNTVHIRGVAGDTTQGGLLNVYGLAEIDSLTLTGPDGGQTSAGILKFYDSDGYQARMYREAGGGQEVNLIIPAYSGSQYIAVSGINQVVSFGTISATGNVVVTGTVNVDSIISALTLTSNLSVVGTVTLDTIATGFISLDHGIIQDSLTVGDPNAPVEGVLRILDASGRAKRLIAQDDGVDAQTFRYPSLTLGTYDLLTANADQDASDLGDVTLDALTVGQGATVGLNLSVSGLAYVDSILNLIGPVTVNDTLNVLKDLNVTGDVTVTGNDIYSASIMELHPGASSVRINGEPENDVELIIKSNQSPDVGQKISLYAGTALQWGLENSPQATGFGIVNYDLSTYAILIDSADNDITLTADLAVNGGDLTTSATTLNLFDATATTVNAFGAGETIDIGALTGTTTINNDLVVGDELTVQGVGASTFAGDVAVNGDDLTSDADLTITPAGDDLLTFKRIGQGTGGGTDHAFVQLPKAITTSTIPRYAHTLKNSAGTNIYVLDTSGVAWYGSGAPSTFNVVVNDDQTAKITIQGANATLDAGQNQIAELTGPMGISSSSAISNFLDNDASQTNASWDVYTDTTGRIAPTTYSASRILLLSDDGNLYVGSGATEGYPGTGTVYAATFVANSTVQLKGYTVGTLPAGTVGMIAYVTDALAPAWGVALVGGGAVATKAFYNGAAWIAD